MLRLPILHRVAATQPPPLMGETDTFKSGNCLARDDLAKSRSAFADELDPDEVD